jgi:hypothetical protein
LAVEGQVVGQSDPNGYSQAARHAGASLLISLFRGSVSRAAQPMACKSALLSFFHVSYFLVTVTLNSLLALTIPLDKYAAITPPRRRSRYNSARTRRAAHTGSVSGLRERVRMPCYFPWGWPPGTRRLPSPPCPSRTRTVPGACQRHADSARFRFWQGCGALHTLLGKSTLRSP